MNAAQPVDYVSETNSEERAIWKRQTLEESVAAEIERGREELNMRESALYALPAAIRRMTRDQAHRVGVHF